MALHAQHAGCILLQEGEGEAGRRVRQLVQEVEAEAAAQERVDDLGEGVQPLEGDRVPRRGARVGVVFMVVDPLGSAVQEVRVADAGRVGREEVGDQRVKATSHLPVSLSGRLSISLWVKATPVTTAPRRAQLSVSRPKWHCRRRSVVPFRTCGPSSASSSGHSDVPPALKPSTS